MERLHEAVIGEPKNRSAELLFVVQRVPSLVTFFYPLLCLSSMTPTTNSRLITFQFSLPTFSSSFVFPILFCHLSPFHRKCFSWFVARLELDSRRRNANRRKKLSASYRFCIDRLQVSVRTQWYSIDSLPRSVFRGKVYRRYDFRDDRTLVRHARLGGHAWPFCQLRLVILHYKRNNLQLHPTVMC